MYIKLYIIISISISKYNLIIWVHDSKFNRPYEYGDSF